jgi:ABC-type amino acid transport substrate-binding protein
VPLLRKNHPWRLAFYGATAVALLAMFVGSGTVWAVGMAAKRSSEDLSSALAVAMADLRESGELAKIFQKHVVG